MIYCRSVLGGIWLPSQTPPSGAETEGGEGGGTGGPVQWPRHLAWGAAVGNGVACRQYPRYFWAGERASQPLPNGTC